LRLLAFYSAFQQLDWENNPADTNSRVALMLFLGITLLVESFVLLLEIATECHLQIT
jgi:hypothetical protein